MITEEEFWLGTYTGPKKVIKRTITQQITTTQVKWLDNWQDAGSPIGRPFSSYEEAKEHSIKLLREAIRGEQELIVERQKHVAELEQRIEQIEHGVNAGC